MDQEKQAFPRELLSQSKQERFHYFKHKVLGHDRLLDVHGQLERAFLYPPGDSLILIYGPTGVGKTTLRMRIEQALLKLEMEAMLKDPGYLPYVSMEAIAASRSYDWREHLIRVLKAANEPLLNNKINPEAHKQSHGKNLVRSDKDSEMVLRRSLESCFHQRHTKYVIIDEAQHLKRVGAGNKYVFQMDTVKSLAETTGAIHILIGTYELLELTGLSAQLCRRSTYIHFSRYSNHYESDQVAFASMLQSFQRHLPLAQPPDLLSYEDYLYEKTFGCIGVLKTLLNSALSMALSSKDEILTKEMLENSAPPLRDLVQMSREIAEGERILRETDEQLIEIKNFLVEGSPKGNKKEVNKTVTISQEPAAGETKREKTDGQSADQPIVKPKQLRPGVRLPKRDKVGRNKKVG